MEVFDLFQTFLNQEQDGFAADEGVFDEPLYEQYEQSGVAGTFWGEEESLEQYLGRETRILSLVREKEERVKSISLFERIRRIKMTEDIYNVWKYICKLTQDVLVKPAAAALAEEIKMAGNNEALENSEAFLRFKELFDSDVTVSTELSAYERELIRACAKNKNATAVRISGRAGCMIVCLDALLNTSRRGKKYRLLGWKNVSYCMVSDVKHISQYVFFHWVNNMWLERFGDMPMNERMQDAVYMGAMNYLKEKLWSCERGEKLIVDAGTFETYPQIMFFLQQNLGYEVCVASPQERVKLRIDEAGRNIFVPFFPELFVIQFEKFISWVPITAYIELFKLLYGDWFNDCETDNYRKEMVRRGRKSARVFETKKNIPEKYLVEMQHSGFNRFFGYVEIDSDCELTAVKEIEKEFAAVNAYYFGNQVSKDVILRFRKLGRHRAAGLYYPYFNCICVDIRHPGSMLHEYFHMLDYTHKEISRRYCFQNIYRLYCKLVKEAADELDDKSLEKARLQGNSKYNLDYYLIHTEVFARCGEMYMYYVRNVKKSILQEPKGIAYPNDEVLMGEITKFFDAFFEDLKKESK